MAKVLETQIKIEGQMDASVQKAISATTKNLAKLEGKVGDSFKGFSSLGKQMSGKVVQGFKSLEKAALAAGAALTTAVAGAAVYGAKKLVDLSNEFQEVTNTIRIGTGATGDQLKELEKSFDNVYANLPLSKDVVATAIADINTLTGATGKSLEDFTHRALDAADMLQTDAKGLYTAAAQSFNAFGIEADQMAGMLDYVWKVSQSTGTGMQELMETVQKNQTTFRSLGYTYEESIALVGQLDKAGFEATDAMSAMQKAVATMGQKGIKDMSKGLQNAIKHIKDAKTDTEAVSLAIEAFGARAGAKMAKGIRDGTISVEELVATMKASPETIGAAADATDTVGDKWQELKNHIEVGLRPAIDAITGVMKDFVPVLGDLATQALPKVQEAAQKLATYITENQDTIKQKIVELAQNIKDSLVWVYENRDALIDMAKKIGAAYLAIKGIQAGIAIWQGMSKAIGGVTTAYKFLTAAQTKQKMAEMAAAVKTKALLAMQKAATAAQWLWNAAMSANPIGLVVAAVAALVAAGWWLYNNWDKVCAWLSAAWQAFADKFPGVAEFLKNVWDGVCTGFKVAWETLTSWFSAAVDFFRPIVETIAGLFSGAWDGIKTAFKTVFEALPAILKAPINAIIKIINGAIDAINKIGFTIPDWVPGLGGKEFSVNIPNLPMLAAGGFTQGPSIAGEAGTEAVISFDPAHRTENQAYLMTAAEMLGMFAAPKETGGTTTINLGGVNFQPVLKVGDNVDRAGIERQLRACLPDLLDMITDELQAREAHRYA